MPSRASARTERLAFLSLSVMPSAWAAFADRTPSFPNRGVSVGVPRALGGQEQRREWRAMRVFVTTSVVLPLLVAAFG